VLFHTLEPDGFTTEEISAARMVGQHLGFALARSTLVARLRAEVERRTAAELDLREALASAEAGNRAKDDFLAMVLASLERNAKLQTRLVDDLIDALRIVSGKLQCVSIEFDRCSVVTDAVDAHRGAAEAEGVLLTLDVGPQAVQ
jgi:signal transduction histidine kinase